MFAKWSDLKQIYTEEVNKPIKRTKLDYQPLYPNNFEKQKVSLVLNVFNDKTVAALKQSKFNDTALFIEKIMRMWHILNVKSPCEGRNLEDPGTYHINSPDDERLNFLERIAASLKLMVNSKKGQRVGGLTVDTTNAWHVSLLGLVDLTKSLLGSGMKYICLGKIQSRIEGEFGVIRQLGGGNYLVSVEQVISSLSLRRFKLYHKLHIDTEERYQMKMYAALVI